MELLVILIFFRRMLQTLLRKLSQLGYNYNTKMWRNILHPHQETIDMFSMSNKVISNQISLSLGMRKHDINKGNRQKFCLIYALRKRSKRNIVTNKNFKDYFWIPFKNIRKGTSIFKALTAAKVSLSSIEYGRWLL